MRALRTLSIDVGLVLVATVLALILRDNLEISWPRLVVVMPYGGISLIAAFVLFSLFGVNRIVWQFTSLHDYLVIALATLAMVIASLALGFIVNRLDGIARALPILQGLLTVALLVGARVLIRLLHRMRRTRGTAAANAPAAGIETVLIIGINKLTELYLQSVAEFASDRVRIAGLLGDSDRVGLALSSHRVLAQPEQLATTLRTLAVHGVEIDRILVAIPIDQMSEATRAALQETAQTTSIKIDYLTQSLGLTRADSSLLAARGPHSDEETQVFSFAAEDVTALMRSPYWRCKRLLDCVGALSLLVMLAPLSVVVAVLVAIDVGFPLLFWQQRPGLGGRPFRVYKFRTMGAAHDAAGRRRSDAARVSTIGAFLRRTRLDELPQLISIVRGQMSFVGPRPLLPVDQPAAYAARLLVRPGLTGWAQVKGGRTIGAADKAALDVWYVHNLSFALDLKVVLATVPMVLFGEQVIEEAVARAWHDLCAAGICTADGLVVRSA